MVVTSPHFEKMAKKWGVYSPTLMKTVAEKGTLQDVKAPKSLKDIFVTAMEVSPEQHVRMQAAFQKYADNAVSKTVNLSNEAQAEDVMKIFELTYKLGCKGTTVYRYGCRDQELYLGESIVARADALSSPEKLIYECPPSKSWRCGRVA